MCGASFEQVRCGACGLEFDERAELEENHRTPCPKCGSTVRSYAVEITEGIPIFDGYTAKGVHAGMSKWFIQTSSHYVPQRSRNNAIPNVERTIDRDDNRYTEKVTLCESGEVIPSTDERLTDHKGHGSDKPKKK
jgi:DNA-directed RNA polymerase subunit RPC12/RpoP